MRRFVINALAVATIGVGATSLVAQPSAPVALPLDTLERWIDGQKPASVAAGAGDR